MSRCRRRPSDRHPDDSAPRQLRTSPCGAWRIRGRHTHPRASGRRHAANNRRFLVVSGSSAGTVRFLTDATQPLRPRRTAGSFHVCRSSTPNSTSRAAWPRCRLVPTGPMPFACRASRNRSMVSVTMSTDRPLTEGRLSLAGRARNVTVRQIAFNPTRTTARVSARSHLHEPLNVGVGQLPERHLRARRDLPNVPALMAARISPATSSASPFVAMWRLACWSRLTR